jgi:hypothetical protein
VFVVNSHTEKLVDGILRDGESSAVRQIGHAPEHRPSRVVVVVSVVAMPSQHLEAAIRASDCGGTDMVGDDRFDVISF